MQRGAGARLALRADHRACAGAGAEPACRRRDARGGRGGSRANWRAGASAIRRSSPPIRPMASGSTLPARRISSAARKSCSRDLVSRLTAQGIQAPRLRRRCAGRRLGGRPLRQARSSFRRDGPSMPSRACRSRPCGLPTTQLEALHRLGIERIGQLAAMPRAPMVRRFGKDVGAAARSGFRPCLRADQPAVPEGNAGTARRLRRADRAARGSAKRRAAAC